MMHAHEFIVATNQKLDYATRVRARLSSRIPPTNDGAFLEPRGCNGWQSAANRMRAEAAKQAKTVAVGCDRLRAKFHGKQGVCGGVTRCGRSPSLRGRG